MSRMPCSRCYASNPDAYPSDTNNSSRMSAVPASENVPVAHIRAVPINPVTEATDTFNNPLAYQSVSLGPLGNARQEPVNRRKALMIKYIRSARNQPAALTNPRIAQCPSQERKHIRLENRRSSRFCRICTGTPRGPVTVPAGATKAAGYPALCSGRPPWRP